MRRTVFSIISGVLLALVMTSLAAHADPVQVRAARHPDFGRIVFVWDAPVGHQLLVQDGGIVLRFNRPIEASYQRTLGILKQYIKSAVPEADGRGVFFSLRGKFDAYSYDSGRSVVVEIADIPGTATKQPAPSPKLESAAAAVTQSTPKSSAQASPVPKDLPTIGIRAGAHPDYTRIVFDWPSKVPYSMVQKGGVVTLQFEQAAKLNLRRLLANPPRLVGKVVSKTVGNTTHVAFAVPATSNVRHFLSGSKVVLDVREPSGSEEIVSLPNDVLASVAPEVPATATQQAEKPKTAEVPKSSAGKDKPKEAATAAKTVETATPEASTSPAAPVKLQPTAQAAGSSEHQATQTQASRAAPPDLGADVKEAVVSVSQNTSEAGGMDLRFDWDEPVAAAVFRRVGKLWIAFDAKRKVNIDLIMGGKPVAKKEGEESTPPPPNLSKMVFGVEQLAATGGTVLRLSAAQEVNPSLRREGFSWILTFRKQPLEAKTPIEINAQPNSPVGARIFLPVPEPGIPIGVTDPDVGDNMVIVPLIPLSHGVVREHIYPEVRLPVTGQGVVVLSMTDNLRVRPLRQGVELASAVPLSISSVSAADAAGSKLGAIGPISRILDLERWNSATLEDFVGTKQRLQTSLAKARGDEAKKTARWNLANFFFANAYAAEALGILSLIATATPDVAKTPEFNLLKGGSNFLMARYGQAAEDLADPGLDDVDEGAFWRAAVIAKSGQMVGAAHELRRTGATPQPYPKPLRFPLALLAAEAAVEIGDIEQAQKFLDALSSAEPSSSQKAEIGFIAGKLAEVGGDEEGAITKWEEVLKVDNRSTYVRASYARVDLLMKMQEMEPAEAIEILEHLRYLWRGDDFEFLLLRHLGRLYLDENGFRKGLQSLRQAATYYRDHEEAPQITQQMIDTFNFLYLKDGADRIAPVTAIALYEEFRELTPAGRAGDEMIRKLADRLVKVDLLEQAANLLDNQVRFRLNGVEKALVGANLALVRALAKEYDKVIEVLDATQTPGIPDDLVARRRHLRAHALMELKNGEDVLAVLDQDKSIDADLIRAEMFWDDADWVNASQSLRRVIRGVGIKPGQELDDEQAIRVLNLATAYTLSSNERALVRIRQDYAVPMAKTRFNEAFRLVAAPLSVGLINPNSVSQRIKMVTNFRSFLDKYKEQLESSELSALTNVGRILEKASAPPGEG